MSLLKRNRSLKTVTLYSFCFLLSCSAEADRKTFYLDCFSRFIENGVILKVVDDFSGKKLVSLDQKTEIHLSKRIGMGWFGDVYELHQISDSRFKNYVPSELVVKAPHQLKYSAVKDPFLIFKKTIENEWVLDQLIREKYKNFTFPVVPILHTVETESGMILIKPKITRGISLREYADQETGQIVGLSFSQKKSLQGIYEESERFQREIGNSQMVDVKPDNLVWIEDKKELEKLGLKKPSFVFYEFSLHGKVVKFPIR